MVWSNWQGAIWRGAMLVVLLWAGLAWTQTPTPRPGDGAERFVYVHENGSKTRCRVLESWQLPDGRMAHLLETVETTEKITIVDEPGMPCEPGGKSQWGKQKRIFSWGLGRRTPPEGSPMPPHMILDSGVVLRSDFPPPGGANRPVIINQGGNENAQAEKIDPAPALTIQLMEGQSGGTVAKIPTEISPGTVQPVQVLEFQNPPGTPQTVLPVVGQAPAASAEIPGAPTLLNVNPPTNEAPAVVQGPVPTVRPALFPRINGFFMRPIGEGFAAGCACNQPPAAPAAQATPPAPSGVLPPPSNMFPNEAGMLPAPSAVLPPPSGTFLAQGGTPPAPSGVLPTPTGVSQAQAGTLPGPSFVTPAQTAPVVPPRSTDPLGAAPTVDPAVTKPLLNDPDKQIANKPAETAAKKPWRPGNVLFGWMSKPAATPAQPEFTKPEEPKALKGEDFLTQENKIAEKRINDRLAGMPKVPFSTAMAQGAMPPATPPEARKPEASPLAIPGAPDQKVDTVAPPGVPKDNVKPANVAGADKRDMWGTSIPDKVIPTGKGLLEPAAMQAEVVKLPPPPVARENDPLTAPERFNPIGDKTKPRATVLPPVAKAAAETGGLPPPPRYAPENAMMPAPPGGMGQPSGWPMGAQSVLAAHSGLQGPVIYVPQPMVTVPQPNHPPVPPPPAMPDAPQLNAYVNAFTPPQPPKGPAPTNPGSTPDWMQPNPMMQQQALMQQQMMQQQMMQQQMMQQQMLAQGYRPNPMNPYLPYNQPMPSPGPMANYGRGYQGPAAPNPFGANPALASGYMSANYPPMMPPGPMMRQQPMLQPASFQQMPPPQAVITQQVEQIIRVLRESPYPAQREWAAQSLTSFEWRAHPQVVPALLQSASQDPAASVRAGCVSCLGRMGAAVEPVFGVLHGMRNDIDPRVRQEVEQAFMRLGQTPMAPH